MVSRPGPLVVYYYITVVLRLRAIFSFFSYYFIDNLIVIIFLLAFSRSILRPSSSLTQPKVPQSHPSSIWLHFHEITLRILQLITDTIRLGQLDMMPALLLLNYMEKPLSS
ncbi:hypothetical protein L1987_44002 [Smallanthus sonchifolius]|uniref:Uncharacterized protein n=1 Tax=Smallanthus sonchifolius TaxID=185202 RepID=A0ACB9GN72_9ASTR|nr:hypothetical protein L1987_44002 [Smallanthus sonchifolius]